MQDKLYHALTHNLICLEALATVFFVLTLLQKVADSKAAWNEVYSIAFLQQTCNPLCIHLIIEMISCKL